MFKNYLYIPSTSETGLNYFKKLTDYIIKEFSLGKDDLVLDIGANDGTLLTFFKEKQVNVLGIDPASNLVHIARLRGIDIIDDFFNKKKSEKILEENGKPKVITATNVLAHISNLRDFFLGIKVLLKKNSIFVCQFPYLVDLIDKNQFDTIYHEHVSYFSLKPLIRLLEEYDLRIFNIFKENIHGGSLVLYIAKKNSIYKENKKVTDFIRAEESKKLEDMKTYVDFSNRVDKMKSQLTDFINSLKRKKKRVAGYGAAAKGNILLNYCGFDFNTIDYIVDSIPFKQGRFTPGAHIPIYPEIFLEKDMPDYTLLLAWNFADEILKKQKKYREKGGKFIITVPKLKVI